MRRGTVWSVVEKGWMGMTMKVLLLELNWRLLMQTFQVLPLSCMNLVLKYI